MGFINFPASGEPEGGTSWRVAPRNCPFRKRTLPTRWAFWAGEDDTTEFLLDLSTQAEQAEETVPGRKLDSQGARIREGFTDSAPRKGFLAGFPSAEEARAAVRRGVVGFEDLPGFERDRARYMHVLPDLLERPHAFLSYVVGGQPRLSFVKRYELTGFDGFVAAGFEIEAGRRLALLSFHPHHLEPRFFRNKRLQWSQHWKW